MKTHNRLLLLLSLLIVACNTYQAKFPDDFAGKWKMDMEGINSVDIWTKINDTVYVAESFLEDNKTESIILYKKENYWYYVPTVFLQNNGQPVKFKLIESTRNKFVFENKEHDFPKRVIYHFRSATDMVVTLNGNGKQEDIYYLKEK